jgi:hypothetical protein
MKLKDMQGKVIEATSQPYAPVRQSGKGRNWHATEVRIDDVDYEAYYESTFGRRMYVYYGNHWYTYSIFAGSKFTTLKGTK